MAACGSRTGEGANHWFSRHCVCVSLERLDSGFCRAAARAGLDRGPQGRDPVSLGGWLDATPRVITRDVPRFPRVVQRRFQDRQNSVSGGAPLANTVRALVGRAHRLGYVT